MSYGIIRVRNLHMGDMQQTYLHNERKFHDVKLDLPNVDPTCTNQNQTSAEIGFDMMEQLNKNLEGVKVRKDSVVALEYVCTLSPEVMEDLDRRDQSIRGILDELKYFVLNKHGEENILLSSYHYDESNPHIHIIVTPIVEKEVRWKNKNGEGIKKEKRLCARDFTGNKELLRQLQTDYHNYLTNSPAYVCEKLKVFDIDLKRGIDARERRQSGKFYSQMTNHIIAKHLKEQRQLAEDLKNDLISMDTYKQEEKRISQTINSITDNMEKKKQTDEKAYKKNQSWRMFR